jgi:hypothetical protein
LGWRFRDWRRVLPFRCFCLVMMGWIRIYSWVRASYNSLVSGE